MRLEKHVQVQSEDLDEGSEAKESFDQALKDGQVLIFYTHPKAEE